MSRNGKEALLKDDIIQGMVTKSYLPEGVCRIALTALIDTIRDGLIEDKVVYLDGLGDFEVRGISAKCTINPITLKRMTARAVNTVRYKPSVSMKKLVNYNK